MKKGNGILMMILGLLILILTLISCTENSRAKNWGGDSTQELECGQKLIEVTWKESDMWILTRPMREGEVAETYTFHEESSFGVWEGTVTIIECK